MALLLVALALASLNLAAAGDARYGALTWKLIRDEPGRERVVQVSLVQAFQLDSTRYQCMKPCDFSNQAWSNSFSCTGNGIKEGYYISDAFSTQPAWPAASPSTLSTVSIAQAIPSMTWWSSRYVCNGAVPTPDIEMFRVGAGPTDWDCADSNCHGGNPLDFHIPIEVTEVHADDNYWVGSGKVELRFPFTSYTFPNTRWYYYDMAEGRMSVDLKWHGFGTRINYAACIRAGGTDWSTTTQTCNTGQDTNNDMDVFSTMVLPTVQHLCEGQAGWVESVNGKCVSSPSIGISPVIRVPLYVDSSNSPIDDPLPFSMTLDSSDETGSQLRYALSPKMSDGSGGNNQVVRNWPLKVVDVNPVNGMFSFNRGSLFFEGHPLDLTQMLTAGRHTVTVYGAEGCCDGAGNIRFKAPGDDAWRSVKKSELDRILGQTDSQVTYSSAYLSSKPAESNFKATVVAALTNENETLKVGYCYRADADFESFYNRGECSGGASGNIAVKMEIIFTAPIEGLWHFDFNVDFGWGGMVEYDGILSDEGYQGGDMWWHSTERPKLSQSHCDRVGWPCRFAASITIENVESSSPAFGSTASVDMLVELYKAQQPSQYCSGCETQSAVACNSNSQCSGTPGCLPISECAQPPANSNGQYVSILNIQEIGGIATNIGDRSWKLLAGQPIQIKVRVVSQIGPTLSLNKGSANSGVLLPEEGTVMTRDPDHADLLFGLWEAVFSWTPNNAGVTTISFTANIQYGSSDSSSTPGLATVRVNLPPLCTHQPSGFVPWLYGTSPSWAQEFATSNVQGFDYQINNLRMKLTPSKPVACINSRNPVKFEQGFKAQWFITSSGATAHSFVLHNSPSYVHTTAGQSSQPIAVNELSGLAVSYNSVTKRVEMTYSSRNEIRIPNPFTGCSNNCVGADISLNQIQGFKVEYDMLGSADQGTELKLYVFNGENWFLYLTLPVELMALDVWTVDQATLSFIGFTGADGQLAIKTPSTEGFTAALYSIVGAVSTETVVQRTSGSIITGTDSAMSITLKDDCQNTVTYLPMSVNDIVVQVSNSAVGVGLPGYVEVVRDDESRAILENPDSATGTYILHVNSRWAQTVDVVGTFAVDSVDFWTSGGIISRGTGDSGKAYRLAETFTFVPGPFSVAHTLMTYDCASPAAGTVDPPCSAPLSFEISSSNTFEVDIFLRDEYGNWLADMQSTDPTWLENDGFKPYFVSFAYDHLSSNRLRLFTMAKLFLSFGSQYIRNSGPVFRASYQPTECCEAASLSTSYALYVRYGAQYPGGSRVPHTLWTWGDNSEPETVPTVAVTTRAATGTTNFANFAFSPTHVTKGLEISYMDDFGNSAPYELVSPQCDSSMATTECWCTQQSCPVGWERNGGDGSSCARNGQTCDLGHCANNPNPYSPCTDFSVKAVWGGGTPSSLGVWTSVAGSAGKKWSYDWLPTDPGSVALQVTTNGVVETSSAITIVSLAVVPASTTVVNQSSPTLDAGSNYDIVVQTYDAQGSARTSSASKAFSVLVLTGITDDGIDVGIACTSCATYTNQGNGQYRLRIRSEVSSFASPNTVSLQIQYDGVVLDHLGTFQVTYYPWPVHTGPWSGSGVLRSTISSGLLSQSACTSSNFATSCDYTAGNPIAFSVTLRDAFGNPTWATKTSFRPGSTPQAQGSSISVTGTRVDPGTSVATVPAILISGSCGNANNVGVMDCTILPTAGGEFSVVLKWLNSVPAALLSDSGPYTTQVGHGVATAGQSQIRSLTTNIPFDLMASSTYDLERYSSSLIKYDLDVKNQFGAFVDFSDTIVSIGAASAASTRITSHTYINGNGVLGSDAYVKPCGELDYLTGRSDWYIKMSMDGKVDYFKPASDSMSYCDLIQSSTTSSTASMSHLWSPTAEPGTWLDPVGVQGNLGGSSIGWSGPLGDRDHLPFWGITDQASVMSEFLRSFGGGSGSAAVTLWGRPFVIELMPAGRFNPQFAAALVNFDCHLPRCVTAVQVSCGYQCHEAGKYQVQVQPGGRISTQPGGNVYDVSAGISLTPVQGSPLSGQVRVLHGVIFPNRCSLDTSLMAGGFAHTELAFKVIMSDEFGNSVGQMAPTLVVGATCAACTGQPFTTWTQTFADADATLTLSASQYSVPYTPQQSQLGTYTIAASVNGMALADKTALIRADVAVGSNTAVLMSSTGQSYSGSSSSVVGTLTDNKLILTLQSYDVHMNKRNEQASGTFSIVTDSPTVVASLVASSTSDGQYVATLQSTISQVVPFKVMYNGVEIDSELRTHTFSPDVVVPSLCSFTGTALNGVIALDTGKDINVKLVDQYDNLIQVQTDTVSIAWTATVEQPGVYNTVVDTGVFETTWAGWSNAKKHQRQFSSTLSSFEYVGSYSVHVKVKNQDVSNPVKVFQSSCGALQPTLSRTTTLAGLVTPLSAGAPGLTGKVDALSTTAIAGTVLTFTLEPRDVNDNILQSAAVDVQLAIIGTTFDSIGIADTSATAAFRSQMVTTRKTDCSEMDTAMASDLWATGSQVAETLYCVVPPSPDSGTQFSSYHYTVRLAMPTSTYGLKADGTIVGGTVQYNAEVGFGTVSRTRIPTSHEFKVPVAPSHATGVTTAAGTGLYGGLYELPAEFTITSRDAFGNVRLGSDDASLMALEATCSSVGGHAIRECSAGSVTGLTGTLVMNETAGGINPFYPSSSTTITSPSPVLNGAYAASWLPLYLFTSGGHCLDTGAGTDPSQADCIFSKGTYNLSVYTTAPAGRVGIANSPFSAFVGSGDANSTTSQLYLKVPMGSATFDGSSADFNAVISGSTLNGEAGIEQKLFLQARDRISQARDTKEDGVQFVITVAGSSAQVCTAPACSLTQPIYLNSEQYNLEEVTPDWTSAEAGKSGQYGMVFVTQKSGLYTLDMLLRGTEIGLSSPFSFQVEPGPGLADKSVVSNTYCAESSPQCAARLRRTLRVQVRDQYENVAVAAYDDLRVHWYGSGRDADVDSDTEPYINAVSAGGAGVGLFDVTWTPPFPGRYTLSVEYKAPATYISHESGSSTSRATSFVLLPGFNRFQLEDVTSLPALASSTFVIAGKGSGHPSSTGVGSVTQVMTWHKASQPYQSCTAFCTSVGAVCVDSDFNAASQSSFDAVKSGGSAPVCDFNSPPNSATGSIAPFFKYSDSRVRTECELRSDPSAGSCDASASVPSQVQGGADADTEGNGKYRLCPCSRATYQQGATAGVQESFDIQAVDGLGNAIIKGGLLDLGLKLEISDGSSTWALVTVQQEDVTATATTRKVSAYRKSWYRTEWGGSAWVNGPYSTGMAPLFDTEIVDHLNGTYSVSYSLYKTGLHSMTLSMLPGQLTQVSVWEVQVSASAVVPATTVRVSNTRLSEFVAASAFVVNGGDAELAVMEAGTTMGDTDVSIEVRDVFENLRSAVLTCVVATTDLDDNGDSIPNPACAVLPDGLGKYHVEVTPTQSAFYVVTVKSAGEDSAGSPFSNVDQLIRVKPADMSVNHSYVFGPGLLKHQAGNWATCGGNVAESECSIFVRVVDRFGNWVYDNTNAETRDRQQLHCYGFDASDAVGPTQAHCSASGKVTGKSTSSTASQKTVGVLQVSMQSPTAGLISAGGESVWLPSGSHPRYMGNASYFVPYADAPKPYSSRDTEDCDTLSSITPGSSCRYDGETDLSQTGEYMLSVKQLPKLGGASSTAGHVNTFRSDSGGASPVVFTRQYDATEDCKAGAVCCGHGAGDPCACESSSGRTGAQCEIVNAQPDPVAGADASDGTQAQINVTWGEVDPQLCRASGQALYPTALAEMVTAAKTSSEKIAGDSMDLFVHVNDIYGNNQEVDGSDKLNVTVSSYTAPAYAAAQGYTVATGSGSIDTTVTAAVWQGGGQYKVVWTPEREGDYEVSIAYAGVPIAGSPFAMTVNTGLIHVANSITSGQGSLGSQTITAGDWLGVVIQTKDRNGNLILQGGTEHLNQRWSFDTGSAGGPQPQEGKFLLSMAAAHGGQGGLYAGAVEAPSPLLQADAMDTTKTVELVPPGAGGSALAWPSASRGLAGIAQKASQDVGLLQPSVPVMQWNCSDRGDGTYAVFYTMAAAGCDSRNSLSCPTNAPDNETYTVSLDYGGTVFPSFPLTVAVVPAPAETTQVFVAHTIAGLGVNGNGIVTQFEQGVAGEQDGKDHRFDLATVDVYGNWRHAKLNVSLSAADEDQRAGVGPFQPAVSMSETKMGKYLADFACNRSGSYTITVKVVPSSGLATSAFEDVAGSPFVDKFRVWPGALDFANSLISSVPSVVPAGTTSSLMVQGRDAWGNIIRDGGVLCECGANPGVPGCTVPGDTPSGCSRYNRAQWKPSRENAAVDRFDAEVLTHSGAAVRSRHDRPSVPAEATSSWAATSASNFTCSDMEPTLVDWSLKDNGDGTYTVVYQPRIVGRYSIQLRHCPAEAVSSWNDQTDGPNGTPVAVPSLPRAAAAGCVADNSLPAVGPIAFEVVPSSLTVFSNSTAACSNFDAFRQWCADSIPSPAGSPCDATEHCPTLTIVASAATSTVHYEGTDYPDTFFKTFGTDVGGGCACEEGYFNGVLGTCEETVLQIVEMTRDDSTGVLETSDCFNNADLKNHAKCKCTDLQQPSTEFVCPWSQTTGCRTGTSKEEIVCALDWKSCDSSVACCGRGRQTAFQKNGTAPLTFVGAEDCVGGLVTLSDGTTFLNRVGASVYVLQPAGTTAPYPSVESRAGENHNFDLVVRDLYHNLRDAEVGALLDMPDWQEPAHPPCATNGTCKCKPGYYGSDCSVFCHGNENQAATQAASPPACVCVPPWQGGQCQFFRTAVAQVSTGRYRASYQLNYSSRVCGVPGVYNIRPQLDVGGSIAPSGGCRSGDAAILYPCQENFAGGSSHKTVAVRSAPVTASTSFAYSLGNFTAGHWDACSGRADSADGTRGTCNFEVQLRDAWYNIMDETFAANKPDEQAMNITFADSSTPSEPGTSRLGARLLSKAWCTDRTRCTIGTYQVAFEEVLKGVYPLSIQLTADENAVTAGGNGGFIRDFYTTPRSDSQRVALLRSYPRSVCHTAGSVACNCRDGGVGEGISVAPSSIETAGDALNEFLGHLWLNSPADAAGPSVSTDGPYVTTEVYFATAVASHFTVALPSRWTAGYTAVAVVQARDRFNNTRTRSADGVCGGVAAPPTECMQVGDICSQTGELCNFAIPRNLPDVGPAVLLAPPSSFQTPSATVYVSGGDSAQFFSAGCPDSTGSIDACMTQAQDMGDGTFQIAMVASRSGRYNVPIAFKMTSGGAVETESSPFTLDVHSGTLAFEASQPGLAAVCTGASPAMCPDGTCRRSNEDCQCAVSTHFRCLANGVCAASCTVVACPAGSEACADGSCRIGGASACPSPSVCPTGTFPCPGDSTCVTNTATECASATACLNSTKPVRCPNSDSVCVADAADCPTAATCEVSGQVLCDDGHTCASSAAACPAAVSCPASFQYYADDDTRRDAAMDWDLSFKCPLTGACGSRGSCPTTVSCPAGLLRCAGDGSCRAAVTKCPASVAAAPATVGTSGRRGSGKCRDSEARCSDGSCVDNLLLCPTSITCPAWAPVKCQDRSCSPSRSACSGKAPSCTASAGLVQCADGSCVAEWSMCGPQSTCPRQRPVKCLTGECTVRKEDCPGANSPVSRAKCPYTQPWACHDGTCEMSQALCSPLSKCSAPCFTVKYSDGTCHHSPAGTDGAGSVRGVVAPLCRFAGLNLVTPKVVQAGVGAMLVSPLPLGLTWQGCPSGQVRCYGPSGMCMSSMSLCPSLATCPAQAPTSLGADAAGNGRLGLSHKCWDGSCRVASEACPAMTEVVCSIGLLRCLDGSCRADLDNCPTQVQCPPSRPVKCNDNRCVVSLAGCVAPSECDATTQFRCPENGVCVFKSQRGRCASAITCTADAPFKCWDATCKISQSDCPAQPRCPEDAPFLCPSNGACAEDRGYCTADRAIRCSGAKPVMCPDGGTCASSRADCAPLSDCPSARCKDGCPVGRRRCLTGSCLAPELCPDLGSNPCPAARPWLCENQLCVSSNNTCILQSNGCTNATDFKCGDGRCVAEQSDCSSSAAGLLAALGGSAVTAPEQDSTCASPLWDGTERDGASYRCPDGSCRNLPSTCPIANGCLARRPYMCADRSCATSLNKCSKFLSCPPQAPFLCEMNGQCASSSLYCPRAFPYDARALPSPPSVPVQLPNRGTVSAPAILCADGSAVADSAKCTPVWPCVGRDAQCGDGSCRSNAALCPDANTCPNDRDGLQMVRCSMGGCAPAGPAGDEFNFCPKKCSGLAQPSTSSICSEIGTISGCTESSPVNCASGQCVAATGSGGNCSAMALSGTSLEKGRTRLGCPPNKPTCCSAPDGSAAAAATFSCPVEDCMAIGVPCPSSCSNVGHVRCVDGTCVDPSALAAGSTCLPAVVCPGNLPILCADGECVGQQSSGDVAGAALPSFFRGPLGTAQSQCRPVLPCISEAGQPAMRRCEDGSCRYVGDACISMCPVARPIMCNDGSCVDDVLYCPGLKHVSLNATAELWVWKPYALTLTVPVVSSTRQSLLLDASLMPAVQLSIPSGAFAPAAGTALLADSSSLWSNSPVPLTIRPVPISVLQKTELSHQVLVRPNTTTPQPFFDDGGASANKSAPTLVKVQVPWEQGIVSAPVSVMLPAGGSIAAELVSLVEIAFQVRSLSNPSSNLEDYCLAYVDEQEGAWVCVAEDVKGKRVNLTVSAPEDLARTDSAAVGIGDSSSGTDDAAASGGNRGGDLIILTGKTDTVSRIFAIVYKPAPPNDVALAQVVSLWAEHWLLFLASFLALVALSVFGVFYRRKSLRLREKKQLTRIQQGQAARGQDEQRKKLAAFENEETILFENPLRIMAQSRNHLRDGQISKLEAAHQAVEDEQRGLEAELTAQIAALEGDMFDLNDYDDEDFLEGNPLSGPGGDEVDLICQAAVLRLSITNDPDLVRNEAQDMSRGMTSENMLSTAPPQRVPSMAPPEPPSEFDHGVQQARQLDDAIEEDLPSLPSADTESIP